MDKNTRTTNTGATSLGRKLVPSGRTGALNFSPDQLDQLIELVGAFQQAMFKAKKFSEDVPGLPLPQVLAKEGVLALIITAPPAKFSYRPDTGEILINGFSTIDLITGMDGGK